MDDDHRSPRPRSRPVLRALGAVLLAALLPGCWLQLGAGPGNTRSNPFEEELTTDDVDALAVSWRQPIDKFITEPIVSGGRVFVTTRTPNDSGLGVDELGVQAYDGATGALLWERTLLAAGGPEVAGHIETPALEDGALWVPYWHEGLGACAGRLDRLDPATGAVLSSDATGPQQSAVAAFGSSVAYMQASCTAGPQLVVRDQATRAVRWTHTFATGTGINPPTVGGGRLFVRGRGILAAFAAGGCGAATCSPSWTEDIGRSTFDFFHPAAGPDGNLVTVGRSSDPEAPNTVVVRDAASGDVRWEAAGPYDGPVPGAITGTAVAGDTLYVAGTRVDEATSEDEAVLDAYPVAGCGHAVCAPAWTADLGPARPAREPAVAGGVVYVPMVPSSTTAPAVAAVDAEGCGSSTCGVLARVPLIAGSGPFLLSAQPYVTSVAEGGVFVGWLPDLHGSTRSQLIALSPH